MLGGDGHQPATEPNNPNIVYAQSQEGYLNRIDKFWRSGKYKTQEGIDEPMNVLIGTLLF